MSVTITEVAKIARLSKIEIDQQQKLQLVDKLGKIMDWMEVLNEVNTKNIEPLLNVHQMTLEMAKDEVSDGGITEEIIKNSPDAKYNYFTVPKVIE